MLSSGDFKRKYKVSKLLKTLEAQERRDIYLHIAEPLYCAAETITAFVKQLISNNKKNYSKPSKLDKCKKKKNNYTSKRGSL